MLADKSRTERPRKTNIGKKVDHPTSNNVPQTQGKRLKVKVTRPTNAHTVNVLYLTNRKAYELQNWEAIVVVLEDKSDLQGSLRTNLQVLVLKPYVRDNNTALNSIKLAIHTICGANLIVCIVCFNSSNLQQYNIMQCS